MRRSACAILIAPLMALAFSPATAQSPDTRPVLPRHFDVLLTGGDVVDGSGAPRRRADIGITGDQIAAIGRLDGATAGRVVSVAGRVVTPGFIDLHAHLADPDFAAQGLLSSDPRRRAAQNYVAQGVTTALSNPDGYQPASLHDQRQQLTRLGIGLNVALTNGHSGLRARVMGKDVSRPATPTEIARMQQILQRDLAEEGSFGLSLGTEYAGARYATTAEQVELARVLPAYNGVFIPHLRSQGTAPMWYVPSVDRDLKPPTLDDAVDEVLTVARETGATVVFTHMKAWGAGYRGNAQAVVAKLQTARDRGDRVYMDVYPYASSGSDGEFVAIPPWAFGPAKDFRQGVQATLAGADATRRADLARDIRHTIGLKGGAENIIVLAHPNAAYVGKRLSEIMAERKLDEVETILALQQEGDPKLRGGARMRAISMSDDDIRTFYRQPWTATSTDGWVVLPEEAVGAKKYVQTNRRVFGSFARRIAHYSLEAKVDTLETAVRTMTALPAEILNLPDRGRIAVGLKADLAVLDLATIRDNTTDLEPSVYPSGVDYVLVNGRFVIDAGRRTLALPGRVLSASPPR